MHSQSGEPGDERRATTAAIPKRKAKRKTAGGADQKDNKAPTTEGNLAIPLTEEAFHWNWDFSAMRKAAAAAKAESRAARRGPSRPLERKAAEQ